MTRNCLCLLLLLCFTLGCNVKQSSSGEGKSSEVEGMSADGSAENANSSGNSFFEDGLGIAENGLLPEDSIRYAIGFNAKKYDGFVEIEVHDPWNEGKLLQRYLLVPRDKPQPEGMPKGTVVRVPLRNIVVYTSVHCAMLDELTVADEIVGVCEPRYIKVPSVKMRLGGGQTKDLGAATSPNIERMIEAGTEVVVASPFDHGGYGSVEKLGIPIIECADYMETDPLGRAEWIKFLGLFTGQSKRADSLFHITEMNYLKTKALVENVTVRPKLLTEKKYGSPWYVASGGSFMARIYKDAGADYIFSYLTGTGSTPMSFETVFDKASHADFWLINYSMDGYMTYSALKSDYSPYSGFDAFRNRRIFGNNTDSSLFYEEVPMHPDYLLTELIAIFHPQLLPDYKLRYYHPLVD